MNFLYILVAASATGKGVLLNQMTKEGFWIKAPKYSTRDNRGIDDDIISIDSKDILNINEKEIRIARIQYLRNICGKGKGIVYYKNNNIYGIDIDDICHKLSSHTIAIIISDFHVIKKLKNDNRLLGKIKVVYLASSIDERELLDRYKKREGIDFLTHSNNTEKIAHKINEMSSILLSASRLKYLSKIEQVLPLLNEQWNNYLPYFDTIKTRSFNIRMLYNRYIDNIHEIDYVILNFYDLEFMFQQMRNILMHPKSKRKVNTPPVFMVCAATSSGKATLMEIVGDLGNINNNIVITKKYAKRASRSTDGRDGMIAIEKDGNFNKFIHNSKDIWKWSFHNSTTEYAVDHSEIRNNINNGIAQIFISNMEQIQSAKRFYQDNIVVLYLHATHETKTTEHIERKRCEEILNRVNQLQDNKNNSLDYLLKKIREDSDLYSAFCDAVKNDKEEIKSVHNAFLSYNINIDHVLLNTGTREDLVEQMINLINYYT